MRFAKTALAAIRQREAPILGLVLNGITSDNPHYYYQQYYHAYYSQPPDGEPAKVAKATNGRSLPVLANSIEAKAMTLVKQPLTAKVRAVDQSKMEVFKKRRAANMTLGAKPHGPNGDPAAPSPKMTPRPPPPGTDV